MTTALSDASEVLADLDDLVDLSDVAVCAARRHGSRHGCALPVLHDGEHDDGERAWRRSRGDQRRRDAVVAVVERLREQVAEPFDL